MLNKNKYGKLFGLGNLPGIKPVFYIIFLFLISFKSNAQENLVPNGSFEEYYSCPASNDLNNGQFELCKYWWKPTLGTPDYFNRCNNGVVGVPNNLFGNQEPFDGDGYVGFVAIEADVNGEYVANEYIMAKLKSHLKPCYSYKFTMYVSLAEESTHGIGRLGAWFSKTNEFEQTWLSLVATPQVEYTGLPIVDTSNWIKVEGTFTADGFENYLTIGYFRNTMVMDTSFIQTFNLNSYAYYYVDSVSLMEVYQEKKPCVFSLEIPNVFTPNNDGVNDIIDLTHYLDFIDKIRIINRWGNTVTVLTKNNPIWDGSNCADGIYYYMIEDEKIKIKQTGFIHLIR